MNVEVAGQQQKPILILVMFSTMLSKNVSAAIMGAYSIAAACSLKVERTRFHQWGASATRNATTPLAERSCVMFFDCELRVDWLETL